MTDASEPALSQALKSTMNDSALAAPTLPTVRRDSVTALNRNEAASRMKSGTRRPVATARPAITGPPSRAAHCDTPSSALASCSRSGVIVCGMRPTQPA